MTIRKLVEADCNASRVISWHLAKIKSMELVRQPKGCYEVEKKNVKHEGNTGEAND